MKSQDQYIIPAEIPASLNSFISECKRLPQVYLISYTSVINSKLKLLTLMNRKMYQAANVALHEVFTYYLELLMNVLLPKSVHQNFTAPQFQLFIEKYYPQFAKTLNNILKIKAMPFQDPAEYVIGESQQHGFQKKINKVLRCLNNGVTELNAFYHNYLDEVVSEPLQEDVVLTHQLVAFLAGHYKLDAVYVLGKTGNTNNKAYSFNLILLSDKLNIQQHDAVVRNVSSHFKGRVQLCCLIHSIHWFQKHQKQLQGFIVKYRVPENRVYLKNSLVCNDTLQLFENTTQLQTYWEQRLNYIEPLFVAFQQRDLVYRHGHILLLKNIFQHLVLALLYQRIHYVPSMYSCRYLMHLFQSFVPDVCQKCIASEDIPEVLNMLLTPVEFFPQPETAPLPCTQQVFAKALCLCEKLYSEIQNNQLLNK